MEKNNIIEHGENKRKRFVSVCSHFIFILILFILPGLVLSMAMPHRHSMFCIGFYAKALIYVAAFYINYFVIIDRTLARHTRGLHIGRFMMYNLIVLIVGIILGCAVFELCVNPYYHATRTIEISFWQSVLKMTAYILRDGVMITLSIGLAVALRLSSIWTSIDNQRREVLAEQHSSELAHLKNQLNPHFLFNTLNSIYALVDIAPDDAKKAIHRLSGLLRYMLYEDVSAVRLAQEVRFIEDYVSLIRLRISHRDVIVKLNIEGHEDTIIPPLLFVALLENVFKFGHTAADNHPIEIELSVSDNKIVFKTCNSFTQNAYENSKDSGIGLANLRRRLDLIYGKSAVLITSANNNLYSTTLTVPLNAPPSITQT